MKRKNISNWLIMLITILIFSCQLQDETIIEKDISVADVQALYQQLNTSRSNGRQTDDLVILGSSNKPVECYNFTKDVPHTF